MGWKICGAVAGHKLSEFVCLYFCSQAGNHLIKYMLANSYFSVHKMFACLQSGCFCFCPNMAASSLCVQPQEWRVHCPMFVSLQRACLLCLCQTVYVYLVICVCLCTMYLHVCLLCVFVVFLCLFCVCVFCLLCVFVCRRDKVFECVPICRLCIDGPELEERLCSFIFHIHFTSISHFIHNMYITISILISIPNVYHKHYMR